MQREAIRVLLLEDDQSDADLLERELRKEPETRFVVTHVENEAGFRAALGQGWDVILADYRLPGFSAPAALRLVSAAGLDIPLVVVSGAIGVEATAEVMREGAADFVAKDRLGGLSRTITRSVTDVHNRRRLRAYQDALRHSLTQNELLDLHSRHLENRRNDAVQLHDNALQHLVVAQAALALRDVPRAAEAIRKALEGVQQVLAQLVPEHLAPGDLRRHAAKGG